MKRLMVLFPRQLVAFGVVGSGGYVVDSAIVRLGKELDANLYIAQLPAFAAAATFTWAVNKLWTFRNHVSPHSLGGQWLRYFAAMLGGALVNYAAFSLTLTLDGIWLRFPELCVAAGSVAGLCFNFPVSKYFLFRPAATAPPEASASRSGS